MATVWIDGQPYEVDGERNMLDVALEKGFDLPYFCWHPAMGSVGACRQCAVKQYKDESDEQGKLVMSCMTPAAEGTRVAVDESEARYFRKSVIEWLMENHPHDCPICDEGGECHLQDMTVMAAHNYRRYRFPKRTYRNQYLGPFIHHEMNRCIQCYRCVRFYHDFAGGPDLQALGVHDRVYFGRHTDGPLESPFSGNLVEVCPTGVFTDKTAQRHYTRKWDLQTAPSVCVQCGLGCNTIPGERYGTLRRIRARYHGKVNGYFLCDRGRYGYEFVNHERRLGAPLRPKGTEQPAEVLEPDDAVEALGEAVRDPGRVVGIGSPRAPIEANFALRALVGPERYHQGVPGQERQTVQRIVEVLRDGPSRSCSLREVESCDAVLVLGEDATNTAPMLALSIRQSALRQPMAESRKRGIPDWHDAAVREVVQDDVGPVYLATPTATDLDDAARKTWHGTPEGIARLGYAVANALDANAPAPRDLDQETRQLAGEIAEELKHAERPLVVSGASLGRPELVEAAANAAWAAGKARQDGPAELFYTVPECNSMGLALLGGDPLESALETLDGRDVDTVVLAENEPDRRLGAETMKRIRERATHLVVLDFLAHDEDANADLVLPATTFADGHGSVVNNEGRVQRYFKVFEPETVGGGRPNERHTRISRESWRWLRDGAAAAELDAATHLGLPSWERIDDVHRALAEEMPAFAALLEAEPSSGFRLEGARLPREPHRYSGRTAMRAHHDVHEPKPPEDADSPLSFTMEGAVDRKPPAWLASSFWSPGWNSVQAVTRFQEELNGPLRGGDPGVRLLEPADGAQPGYHDRIPAPSEAGSGAWRVVPLHHIHGSEELSVYTPAVREMMPEPYVAVGSEDAEALGVGAGDPIDVQVGETRVQLPARLVDGLPRGVAGFPVGLPGFDVVPLPDTTRLAAAGASTQPTQPAPGGDA